MAAQTTSAGCALVSPELRRTVSAHIASLPQATATSKCAAQIGSVSLGLGLTSWALPSEATAFGAATVRAVRVKLASPVCQDFTAGTVGGMLGLFAGHPLDTVKTRLQAMTQFSGSTTSRVLSDTMRAEGFPALYRGLSMPLYTTCLVNAVVFSVHGASVKALNSIVGGDHARLFSFVGGCAAGLAQSPIVTLADLVKCQRQVQTGSCCRTGFGLATPCAILAERVRAFGYRKGCFEGFGATVGRDWSFGVYFLVYEEAKSTAEAFSMGTVSSTLLAGGLAGCISLGIVHPVDVVKSRIQALPIDTPASERAAWQIARKGVAREGGGFLLKGFGAAMQRAFLVNAVTFGGYELAMSALARVAHSPGSSSVHG